MHVFVYTYTFSEKRVGAQEGQINVRHSLADRMLDEALDDHYKMRSHTYGLEQ